MAKSKRANGEGLLTFDPQKAYTAQCYHSSKYKKAGPSAHF
jgi:hypothetical protein